MSVKQQRLQGQVTDFYVKKYILDPLEKGEKPMSKIGLARLMYKENSEVFTTVEGCRSLIRQNTGAMGKARENLPSVLKKVKGTQHPTNPYGLPGSDEKEWAPYVLPKNANRILLLSDIHIPYHNIEALTLAIDYGKENDINTVYFNGDTVDCYALSRWDKDPRKRDFKYELDCTRSILDLFRKEFPDALFYFKIGNHEARYENWLISKGKELLGIDEFKLANLLRFGENRINLIDDKQTCKAGKLNILHGHEFGRSVFSPVNPARGYYTRAKESMIAGHNHQTSEHTETSLNGDMVTCWSTGCMSEMHPDYMPINKWNRGFADITINKDGSYHVKNMRIIDGKIV